MKGICCFCFLLLFLSRSLWAFDLLPEYQGLTEADLSVRLRPTDVDSEYQTVVNAYTPPLDWEKLWWSRPRTMDLSVGSMSNTRFVQYERLKAGTDLLEGLRFQFTYFSQRDREIDQVRHVLELSQRIMPGLHVNLYGEPSLYKRENDAGLAVVVSNESRWSQRFYLTLHDLTRAEHNDEQDKFAPQRHPLSYGWSGQWEGDRFWSRFGLRYDQPVEWRRPQDGGEFSYHKRLAFADLMWARSWGGRLQYDDTEKGFSPDTGAPESWRLRRLQLRAFHRFGEPEAAVNTELAVMHALRRWTDQNGREFGHSQWLPSAAVCWRGVRRAQDFDRIRAEYELSWLQRFGDQVLGAEQKRAPVEQRLQTAYEFSFNNGARLALAVNFDLDEWTPVPTFEGGNARFRADF